MLLHFVTPSNCRHSHGPPPCPRSSVTLRWYPHVFPIRISSVSLPPDRLTPTPFPLQGGAVLRMLRAYLVGDQLGDGSNLLMRRRQLLMHESEDTAVMQDSGSSSSSKRSSSDGLGVAAIARSAAAAVISGRRALTGAAAAVVKEAETAAEGSVGAGWRLGRRLVQQVGGGDGGSTEAKELPADEEADEVGAGVDGGARVVVKGSLPWCLCLSFGKRKAQSWLLMGPAVYHTVIPTCSNCSPAFVPPGIPLPPAGRTKHCSSAQPSRRHDSALPLSLSLPRTPRHHRHPKPHRPPQRHHHQQLHSYLPNPSRKHHRYQRHRRQHNLCFPITLAASVPVSAATLTSAALAAAAAGPRRSRSTAIGPGLRPSVPWNTAVPAGQQVRQYDGGDAVEYGCARHR